MDSSITAATQNRKLRNVGEFLNWADSAGLDQQDVLPPAEATLCNFAASFAGRLAGATVKAKISAVKGWVARRGMQWKGRVNLGRVVSGVERRAPASSFRKERDSVEEDHLRLLHEGLDLSGKCGKDRAIAAAAKALFAGQMRAGEPLGSSPALSDFDHNTFPTVGDLLPPNNTGEHILCLPKTKTPQSRGEKVILVSKAGRTCPNCAFRHHLQVNHLGSKHPLMAYQNEHNKLAILMKSNFLAHCNDIWSSKGLLRMTGHCFRIGGTTHLLISGVPPDVVKALRRWKSHAFSSIGGI
ncbi:hypothetical protein BT96DRAFT_943354 [Gymnopus androsaceus JB14]|uniref:Uncharacterized protein n=1 Tax=Gymnopus androsaceus JB14 TaxID=1447944 RepID=A0A6A4H8S2_9AGAR|nr:hypothetical protein BT96DRAFT_943354 [Gymnopus androsaceus JB14]